MPYNFAADSFHTKKLCSRLSSTKCNFRWKLAILHFWAPFGGLWATYYDHLWLILFLLVLTELVSLGVTAEALWANIGSKSAISLQQGPADPKLQLEGVVPTNHSSSQKTVRQTDRILIARPCLHSMQLGKNAAKWTLSWLKQHNVVFQTYVNKTPRQSTFLTCCMEWRCGLAVRILSVCLSVKRVHCDKNGRKICPDFYTVQ